MNLLQKLKTRWPRDIGIQDEEVKLLPRDQLFLPCTMSGFRHLRAQTACPLDEQLAKASVNLSDQDAFRFLTRTASPQCGRPHARIVRIPHQVENFWGDDGVSDLALESWEEEEKTLSGYGANFSLVPVHHNQTLAHPGYRWSGQLLLQDAVSRTFALAEVRDNLEMESFNGDFKTESHSLLWDAEVFTELQEFVAEFMDCYNKDSRHLSIANQSPQFFVMTQRSRS